MLKSQFVIFLLLVAVTTCISSQQSEYKNKRLLATVSATPQCLINNCTLCSNPTTCTICNSTGQCCPVGCTSCANNICSACNTAIYTFNSASGYCQVSNPCSDAGIYGCLTCNLTGNVNLCTQCVSAYYYVSLSNLCLSCSTNCQSCTNFTVCLGCNNGYYVNNQTCSACLPNCALCNNPSSCTTCINNFYVNPINSQCAACGTGCQICTNVQICTTCGPKYYLVGQACQSCPIGCTNCQGAVCSVCDTGYYFYEVTSTCPPCPSVCTTCVSNFNCLTCRAGYWLNNSAINNCQSCPNLCQTCTSSTVCNSCSSRSYLDINSITGVNLCLSCSSNCLNCISGTVCKDCEKQYEVKDNACKKKPFPWWGVMLIVIEAIFLILAILVLWNHFKLKGFKVPNYVQLNESR